MFGKPIVAAGLNMLNPIAGTPPKEEANAVVVVVVALGACGGRPPPPPERSPPVDDASTIALVLFETIISLSLSLFLNASKSHAHTTARARARASVLLVYPSGEANRKTTASAFLCIERRSLRARNAFFKNLKIAATLRREDKERETHTQLRRTKKENVSLSLRVLFFSPDRGARAKRTLSLVKKNALPFLTDARCCCCCC